MHLLPVAIAIELDHGHPWHQDSYAGIMKFAKEVGWKCIVDPYMVGMLSSSKAAQYSGIIGRISATWYDDALQCDIPMVNIWANSPVTNTPSVFINYSKAANLAVDHLIDNGFKNITYFHSDGDVASTTAQDTITARAKGKNPFHISNATVASEFEASPESYIEFRNTVFNYLAKSNKPLGIITFQATVARYIAQICHELEIAVPNDIGIVTLQDTYHITESADPPITSVEGNYTFAGYRAASTLQRIMAGHKVNDVQYIDSQYLIQRDSTNIFHCTDPVVRCGIQFIRENIKNNLASNDVADHLCISSRTVHRHFQKYLDKSASHVIAYYKLNSLKLELITTNKSLFAISQDFSFSSSTQMARFFKKYTGLNPSEFRKEQSD